MLRETYRLLSNLGTGVVAYFTPCQAGGTFHMLTHIHRDRYAYFSSSRPLFIGQSDLDVSLTFILQEFSFLFCTFGS